MSENNKYKQLFLKASFKDQDFVSSYPYRVKMVDGKFESLGHFICAAEQCDAFGKILFELLFFNVTTSAWYGYIANSVFEEDVLATQNEDMLHKECLPERINISHLQIFIDR